MPLDGLLEENKVLAPFTTLGVGGPARWFLEARAEEHIAEAAAWARDKGVRLFVLGAGSNLVVSDDGFEGLAVHVTLRGIETAEIAGHRIYRGAAGEDWDAFVQRCVE